MIAWVYEVVVAESAVKVVSKLGFRFADVVSVESLRSDPEDVLRLTLSNGRETVIQAPHSVFLEHWHQNAPLLLARLKSNGN